MAPRGRARPAFSPPRPKQAKPGRAKKSAPSSKVKKPCTAVSKNALKGSKSTTPTSTGELRRRSRLISPTPSASDSQGDDDCETLEEAVANDEGDDDEQENNNSIDEPSPEPDYILAEVSTTTSSTASPSIPIPLIHRILHSHFKTPDTSKMSGDARDLIGQYVDVFVREAIMRCAYEKTGSETEQNEESASRSTATKGTVDDGWLEVDDLEKVAVQLCLDF